MKTETGSVNSVVPAMTAPKAGSGELSLAVPTAAPWKAEPDTDVGGRVSAARLSMRSELFVNHEDVNRWCHRLILY